MSHTTGRAMEKEYWSISEVTEIFRVNGGFVTRLVEEEIVCPVCREGSSTRLFSASDLEKLRIAKVLMEDMEVNLAGVEVILRMRQNMLSMRRQFDDILEEMACHLKTNIR
ncbi:MAG: MerR family transcriptional regulator [Desulfobacteraceae bacterium]|nr:MerR family transcriptional regulator [Desulfobacteraceae bacterium]